MGAPRKSAAQSSPRRPPATTIESRENQLVALAVDLAEKQIRDGTATSQVITHYLKLGSAREALERDKLRSENELLIARIEREGSNGKAEALYADAIRAFGTYRGEDPEPDYED